MRSVGVDTRSRSDRAWSTADHQEDVGGGTKRGCRRNSSSRIDGGREVARARARARAFVCIPTCHVWLCRARVMYDDNEGGACGAGQWGRMRFP